MDLNLINSDYAENYTEPQLPVEDSEEQQAMDLALAYHNQNNQEESNNIYTKITRWALVVGVFLAPLFFLPWTTSRLELNKELLLLGVVGVGLIAWLLALVSTGRFAWRANVFDKGVLAVLVATLGATIFSVARYHSLFGSPSNLAGSLVMVCVFSILYFLIVNTVQDEGRSLTNIIATSLTIALVYGLLQVLGVFIFKYLNISIFNFSLSHAFNSVGSVDGLGVLGAVSLPLLAGNRNQGRWLRYVHLVGLVAGLVLLVILNWWVLWTIAIVGMAGWIVFESLAHERFSISRFIVPMTVIVVGVFLMVVQFNVSSIKNNLPVEVAPSFQLSGHVVRSVLKENPATGYGPTNFSLAFDKYGANRLTDSTLSTAKFFAGTSEIFGAVTGGGLLMILALLVMLWAMIQGVIYYIRDTEAVYRNSSQYVWATLLALGSAFLLYPFNTTLMFMAYAVLGLAVLTLWGADSRVYDAEHNIAVSLASSLGFIGGLILVLVGAYFGASGYIADVYYARALADKNINQAASDLVTAVNWNGYSDAYYRTASQASLGLLNQELKKPADKTDTQHSTRLQNYMSSAINLAKIATDLDPRESMNWDNLGNVYQSLLGLVNGVDSLSASAYQKAADLRPGDASFYNEIGNLYLSESQILRQIASGNANASQLIQQANASLALAEINFKKAIDLSNNYGLAIYNLGIVYDQEGKLADAIRQLERIAPFNTDQPDLLFELGLLYYRNSSKDKAFTTLQNVLVLQPNYANARWYLSLIYEERKDIPNAIDQLNKILAVETNKDNQTVLTRLQQLQAGISAPVKGVNQKPL
jgi:tetratricopeptide (TPR) repeat protein